MSTSIDEFKAYSNFIKKNFPKTIWYRKLNRIPRKFYYFFNDLKALDIIVDYDYITVIQKQEFIQYVIDLRNAFLNLLLVLPLNDKHSSSSAFRLISELELKIFLLGINFDKNKIGNIENISFRHLWENCIKTTYQYKNDSEIKICLDKIRYSFGENSEAIHGKQHSTDSLIFLEKIISTNVNEFTVESLQKELKIIHDFVSILFEKILKINSNQMTMGQKGILKDMYQDSF